MLHDFVLLTSALTGAIAVVALLRSCARSFQTKRVRHRLLAHLHRLRRLDLRLSGVVVELDDRLSAGVKWTGVDVWPAELSGRLSYLEGNLDELERNEAALRAIEADGSTERLRLDIERMSVVLHLAYEYYLDGTLDTYRASQGAAQPAAPGGGDVTPALGVANSDALTSLRAEFTSLMRTCFYRLDAENAAERYRAWWPIRRWELEGARSLNVWAHEPSPVDW